MALRIPYPCYGSEPPVSNGVTCRSTAPNFFRPASINRASAKLENRVIALRNVFLLTAAGSFFVLILTCRSVCASCNSSVCAEDVILPHSAFCSPGSFVTGLGRRIPSSSGRSRTPAFFSFLLSGPYPHGIGYVRHAAFP